MSKKLGDYAAFCSYCQREQQFKGRTCLTCGYQDDPDKEWEREFATAVGKLAGIPLKDA